MTVFPLSGNNSQHIVAASTASPSAGEAPVETVRVFAFGNQSQRSEVFLDEENKHVTTLRFSDAYNHDVTKKPFSLSGFGDLDDDNNNETIMFGHLVSSTLLQNSETILFDDMRSVPDESVFINRSDDPDRLAHIHRGFFSDRLQISELRSGKLTKIQSLHIPAQLGRLVERHENNTPRRELFSLPDIDGDGTSELLTVHELGFQIWLSDYQYDVNKTSSLHIGEVSPFSPFCNANMFRIGQFYDYNSDGIIDFWISFRGNSKDSRQMWLIDGRRILENASSVIEFPQDISLLTISDRKLSYEMDIPRSSINLPACNFNGASLSDETDRFGSSISSIPGDFDGDSYPEVVTTGHYSGGYSGNLYVVPGNLIQSNLSKTSPNVVDVANCRVLRILGPMSGELAPPYEHANNVDFNADGVPDVIVPADTYAKPHPSSGAVFVLSGARIGTSLAKLSRECPSQ